MSDAKPSSARGRPFRQDGEHVTLWRQAPKLDSVLPPEFRGSTLTFPLTSDAWTPLRAACAACILMTPNLALGHWLPGLLELDEVALVDVARLPRDATPLPARVFHALLESLIGYRRAHTWADLGRLSAQELNRLPGIGVSSQTQLLEWIVDVGLRCVWPRPLASEGIVAAGATPEDGGTAFRSADTAPSDPRALEPDMVALPSDPAPAGADVDPSPAVSSGAVPHRAEPVLAPILPVLELVAAWASAEAPSEHLEEILALAMSDDAPPDVREAMEVLRAARVPPTPPPAIGELIDALLGQLPENRRRVFEARVLQPQEGTLESLGERLGVTRERVRQIEGAATRTVRAMMHVASSRALRWRAHTVRRRLGRLAPQKHPFTREVFAEALGLGAPPRQVAFLMWVAGPYELRDGMWIADGRRGTHIEADLAAGIPPGGVSEEEFHALLERCGVPPVFADAVGTWYSRVHRVADRWYLGKPKIADVSVQALSTLGRPATVVEIIEAAGLERDVRSFTHHIQISDRIVRVTKDSYALREWGLEEYAGIADAIGRGIDDRGGFASIAELMHEISNAYDVSPTSVRAYADAPMFVLEGHVVRRRRSEEPFVAQDQLPGRRRSYRFVGELVIVFDLDREVMRGSGRALFADVTQALGVAPGSARRFQGKGFDVGVSWPMTGWIGGSVGSLRGAIAVVGAIPDQRVRLAFDVVGGTVQAALIDDEVLLGLDPLDALKTLTGARGRTRDEVLDELDEALGRPLAGVEATLRARDDHDVAGLVRLV